MKARILNFPVIVRKESAISWFERVGSEVEIQEYRQFLNEKTAHKIVYVDFRRKR